MHIHLQRLRYKNMVFINYFQVFYINIHKRSNHILKNLDSNFFQDKPEKKRFAEETNVKIKFEQHVGSSCALSA